MDAATVGARDDEQVRTDGQQIVWSMSYAERSTQPRGSATRTRASVGILSACVLALVASACGSSPGDGGAGPACGAPTTARAQKDFAGLVDIGGGRQIWATCKGQGSPTVVLLSGHGNGAEDWSLILDPDDPAHQAPGDDRLRRARQARGERRRRVPIGRPNHPGLHLRPVRHPLHRRGDHAEATAAHGRPRCQRSPLAPHRDRRTGALRVRLALLRRLGLDPLRPHLPRQHRRSGDGRHRQRSDGGPGHPRRARLVGRGQRGDQRRGARGGHAQGRLRTDQRRGADAEGARHRPRGRQAVPRRT